jgi:hypothetical protein
LGRPRLHADSGPFSGKVAWACVKEGGDFAIAAPARAGDVGCDAPNGPQA